MSRPKLPAEEKFWSKVNKTNDCWLWTASTAHGYGSIRIDGKLWRAHRLSYLWAYGELFDDLDVLHCCDTPCCVNPDHLFLGTHADNMADMAAKGRSHAPRKRHRPRTKTKLTVDQVRAIRRIHNEGKLGTRKIGQMFNVHRTTIRSIIRREYWLHVTESQHDVDAPAD